MLDLKSSTPDYLPRTGPLSNFSMLFTGNYIGCEALYYLLCVLSCLVLRLLLAVLVLPGVFLCCVVT